MGRRLSAGGPSLERTDRRFKKVRRLSDVRNGRQNNKETNDEENSRAGGTCRHAGVQRRAGAAGQRQDRRAQRHVEPLRRHWRSRLGRGGQARYRRLHQGSPERQGRDDLRRPSEQAGRWLQHRQPVVRRRQGRHDHRRAELGRRARGQPGRRHQEQTVHRFRRRSVRPHRSEVQRRYHSLDL